MGDHGLSVLRLKLGVDVRDSEDMAVSVVAPLVLGEGGCDVVPPLTLILSRVTRQGCGARSGRWWLRGTVVAMFAALL